jgi:3-hydroxyisobutyrate dehydrogenase-like beta-hydroxyacid dehydrogenase
MTDVIGFIGAGQLGEPMVRRLLVAGHDVVVYARRDDVRARLRSAGASLADSVADLARRSDILISCLFSDAQLRETGLGPQGFIANAKPGAVFVSHITGTLSTLATLKDGHRSAPVMLDAPVSGTADDVAAGTLTVLVGGANDAVSAVTPVLSALRRSDRPHRGAGQRIGHQVDQQPTVSGQCPVACRGNRIG